MSYNTDFENHLRVLREEGFNRTHDELIYAKHKLLTASRNNKGVEAARTRFEIAKFHHELYKNWRRAGEVPNRGEYLDGITEALDEFHMNYFSTRILIHYNESLPLEIQEQIFEFHRNNPHKPFAEIIRETPIN